MFLPEQKLKDTMGCSQESRIIKISENIFFFNHFGASNVTLVLGEKTGILIDAFESDYYAQKAKEEMRKITKKPIETIIYTHQHADHISGAGVFHDTVKKVISRVPGTTELGKTALIQQYLGKRALYQFGRNLTPEEAVSSGLGAAVEVKGKPVPLKPNVFLNNPVERLEVDGIVFTILAAPGETDDHQFVWLPQEKIFCCGDNYYASWPNLSAIRGGQYRDVCSWIDALEHLLELKAEILLPGHGVALFGNEQVHETISGYREGLQYVLEETLKGINQGLTPDELVQVVKLPKHLAELPQLQEFYGTVAWSVRGIYNGYVGWFDGNATHLFSMDCREKAEKEIRMMGGETAILKEIANAIENKEMQWVLELTDILQNGGVAKEKINPYRIQALIYLGRMQTSANGRHYYLSEAKAIGGEYKDLLL